LSLLKDARIPFVGIEGNHDQRHTDSDYSWLRSLANWNLIYLLEPRNVDGKIIYEQWNEDTGKGGFVDIGRARIFGSHWYGASANWAIPMLTEAIKENCRRKRVVRCYCFTRTLKVSKRTDSGALGLPIQRY
jgi:hypothetical protein